MRPPPLALALAPCLTSACLLAGPAWDPIPPETWAVKDTSAPGDPGATIVKATYHFTNYYLEYQVRVRIYSERGKAAASWGNLPGDASGVEGRVVYPDGRELPFNPAKDFHPGNKVHFRNGDYEEQVVVPPGLTGNCLVDYTYRNPRWLPLHPYGRFRKWWFAGAYPVQTLVVKVPRNASFSCTIFPGIKARGDSSQLIDTGDATVYTMKDIPALQKVPFTLDPTQDSPSFVANNSYFMHVDTGKDPAKKFWDAFTLDVKLSLNERLKLGGAFQDFSRGIRKNLPQTPIQLAIQLALRLQAQIRNLSAPTFQEYTARTRDQAEERIRSGDLDGAVKRGATNAPGMTTLYFRLLQDAGIHPKVAFVTNRNLNFFNLEDRNTGQFETAILGIEEPGQPTLWVDPGMRFAPPGLLLPRFQGTTALVVDSRTWTHETLTMPLLGPLASIRTDAYHLELLEDEDRITLEARFAGGAEYDERRTYFPLEPREQDRRLKESLETLFKDFQVASAHVENAADPTRKVSLKVEGRFERATSATRKVVPFPLTPEILAIPKDLPATRKELIVLPQALTRTAECTFRIPPGYQWKGAPPFIHGNLFGDVAFRAERVMEAGGESIKATLVVRVKTPMAEAEAWPELVTFLGWLREAQDRVLVLERGDPVH